MYRSEVVSAEGGRGEGRAAGGDHRGTEPNLPESTLWARVRRAETPVSELEERWRRGRGRAEDAEQELRARR